LAALFTSLSVRVWSSRRRIAKLGRLLPLTYNFQIMYAGPSQQNSQDVSKNPNVKFQTVHVHSDSGKCTSYNAGGWKTFTQDMQLLPGTYTFRFSDGTKDTSYTLVVGAVKHIH
jgi:hypothetical protein